MTLLRYLVLLAVFLATIVANSAVFAAQSDAYESPALSARLIAVENAIPPDAQTVSAALSLTLSNGWKTYWRSPGEVGLPPEIDWAGSKNLASADFQWPAPTRFRAFGIENFGYEKAVTYPIQITLEDPGAALELRARVSLLVCSDVCVPLNFDLALSFPPGTGMDQTAAAEIAKWAARIPTDGDMSEIALRSAALTDDQSAMVVEFTRSSAWKTPDVFPELGDGTAFGAPDIRLSHDKTLLWAKLPILALSEPPFPLLLTLTDEGEAVTFGNVAWEGIPADPPYTLTSPDRAISTLVWIAILAFAGGVILNAMPCVLPVLSIKLSSALKMSDRSPHRIRMGFLMTALGTLAFMWVLAAAVLGLQGLGYSIGWGTQFQNPYFLIFLILVLVLFAATLFGAFEIPLPSTLATQVAGIGRENLVGDFATGAFAAILATPCSAPLLGTAIAFALTGSSLDVRIIFTAMGFGLALPYLLVAAWPRLVASLPRPGRWMLVVKVALGVLLSLTALWLLWVLSGVSSQKLAMLVGLVASTAVICLAAGNRLKMSWASWLAVPLTAVALALPAVTRVDARSVSQDDFIAWVPFERGEIARHVSQGHAVFIDVTADWCLTCKANKTLVLDRSPVVDALAAPAVIAMQADWTRPDPKIQAFLEANGRFGIPFNIVYGPSSPEGIPLLEVLTPSAVIEALEEALGTSIKLSGRD